MPSTLLLSQETDTLPHIAGPPFYLLLTQGFAQEGTDPDGNTRAAALGVCFLFLVHCFLQCRDSLFVRPHPGVWRLVHGVGMLYLFGLAILLLHP